MIQASISYKLYSKNYQNLYRKIIIKDYTSIVQKTHVRNANLTGFFTIMSVVELDLITTCCKKI